MADQTVRTIYQANVAQAQRSMTNLAKDTDKAADSVDKLDKGLDAAGKKTVKPKIDVDIQKAEKEVQRLTKELDELEKLDADVRVEADVEAARGDLAKAEAELKALQGAKAEMVVTVDADGVDLDGVGDAAEEAGAGAGARAGDAILDGLNSTPIAGAVAGIIVGAVGFIASGVIGAIEESLRAEDVFGAATGLDPATSRKFGAAAGAAYGNAWGESVQDNLNTARSALANGLLDEASTGREIQVVTEQLSALSEIMDVDVKEAAEAAGTMIKNGLAADAEEAFDVILTGQQDGLNRSEDWLDTLREYSPMFESIGLSGAEAGGLIAQAMDAGARNSDVAADALKEFSIRAQDDSATTRQAFEDMGLDADEMAEKVAAGGDTAAEGLDTVLDGLREIEDPVQRNLAGVALFGTMWEDMGNGAGILAMDLDELGDSWVNVGDTTASAMDRMQSNATTAWEKIKRNVTNSATQVLGGIASTFEEPILQISDWVSTHTAEILEFLIDVGSAFFDLARAAVEFGATTIEVLGDVAGSLDGIVDGVGRAVEAMGHLTGDQDMIDLGLSIQGAADDMGVFAENADGAADTLRTTVGGALDEAEAKFNDWTGPALMQAEINDAVAEMVQDLDGFVAYVDELPGGTITINGDTTGGEEAMNTLITKVSESNGTVDINGETVQAEDALQHVKDLAAEGAEIVITANTEPAKTEVSELNGIMTDPEELPEIPVGADTDPAKEEVSEFSGVVTNGTPAEMPVSADVEPAHMDIVNLENTIAASGGSVTINGDSTPGDQVLDTLMGIINSSDGTVTIDGDEYPADQALKAAIEAINSGNGTVTINGDASDAEAEGDHAARDRSSTIHTDAETSGANSEINYAARDRYSRITVTTSYVNANRPSNVRQMGFATGGQVPGYGGYSSGYGVVPGPSAPYGVDNVLWPSYAPVQEGRATGGPILSQPLAGGEWVVNPVSSKQHDSLLAAINAGATRSQIAASFGAGSGGSNVDMGAVASIAEAAARNAVQNATFDVHVGGRAAGQLVKVGTAHNGRAGG